MIYVDDLWSHEDTLAIFRAYAASLAGKRPHRELEPLLDATKAMGRAVTALRHYHSLSMQSPEAERAIVDARAAVLACSDVLGDPYAAYVGAASHDPGRSAFSLLVRGKSREKLFEPRLFDRESLVGVADRGVDMAHAVLGGKRDAFVVFCATETSRANVLNLTWDEDGHRFLRRVRDAAYEAVYQRKALT